MKHLVVIGFDEIVSDKYLSCIKEAIDKGFIDSYSIIDLESQRDNISSRVKDLDLKPEAIYYLPDLDDSQWSSKDHFEPTLKKIIEHKKQIKVYIATELKAHEGYLRYCIENGIPSLTEKPIFSPMINGRFAPSAISSTMDYLLKKCESFPNVRHSVMTLSRYHRVYNDLAMNSIKEMMLELQQPITSFHFRTAGGVWNLHREYESREDHPYKYGYGMIMHGGYHYIDLTTQFLELNKLIYPEEELIVTLSSFGAYPQDQNKRISSKISEMFDDNKPEWGLDNQTNSLYGETDITTSFCVKLKKSGRIITLGTISLEQTTPSVRNWDEFPEGVYNKNGRTSFVDFEAQLSTLHTVNVQCWDVPVKNLKEVERIDAFARVSTRTNASLLKGQEYTSSKSFDGLFHSDSNRALMTNWLLDCEEKSTLKTHLSVMKFTQALSESLREPGFPIEFSL